MTQFFYDIIGEMYNYDRVEVMKNLYEEMYNPDTNYLWEDARHRMVAWCNEQLDLADIPKGYFRTLYMSCVQDDVYVMLKYVKEHCDAEAREACGEVT